MSGTLDRRLRRVFLWACLIMLCPCVSQLIAGDPTAKLYLDAYQQSLHQLDRIVFKSTETARLWSPVVAPGTLIRESTIQVWRDKRKWKVMSWDWDAMPYKGKTERHRTTSESLFPENGCIRTSRNLDTGQLVLLARMDNWPERDKFVYYSGTFGRLFGYFDANSQLPLTEILQQSELLAREESVNGSTLRVLEGKGKWGTHTLWLDPQLGYLPRRIDQSKQANDWGESGKPISSAKYAAGSVYPNAFLTTWSDRFEVTNFDRVGNQTLVTSFKLMHELRFANGQTVTFRTDVNLSEIQLNPDFSKDDPFRISTSIPNGAYVQVDDREGINYEWQDGKIVKSIRQDSLANLRGNWFQRGGWATRGLIVLAIIAAAGLLAALYLYRRRLRAT